MTFGMPLSRRPRRLAIALSVSSVVLMGCGQTVYVTGRGSAPSGTTTISTSGTGSGDITIPLGAKVYSGRWVYVPQGGGVGFTTATAFSGGRSATGTGTTIIGPSGGGGTVVMAAEGAPSIRCAFAYSEWTRTGAGECQDDAGGSYDLQITK
jgi:hypothetical protein